MKILVADDSRTNLNLIMSILIKLGHKVRTATSGALAIEEFRLNRPDLVILDVMMENIDGFECARQIRRISDDDWIPIIFLSANVDDESIAKGIDAGGDDYLTKPFSEITLAAKIKAMQRIADMRQKLFETTQKLYLLSSTDPLTGIYNRLQFDRSLKEIVSAANRHHHTTALLFIDLDNFKNINDTFGHHIGDLLLIEVASRLKTCLRANDFLARLGGDEFAVVLAEIHQEKDATVIAHKILEIISKDYNLDNHNLRIGASIGIASYPSSARSQDDLIQNADIAMYHAKASGRNNYQYFTDELSEKYKQQINLEHALKFALERNEFYLTYQPIIELQTNQLMGLETLLCWDHPKYGLISPSVFIPLAEEIGIISYIGDWVLRMACQQAVKWPLDQFKNFKLAINISSRQLLHENFLSMLTEVLQHTHMSPQHLELELTETIMMSYTTLHFKETTKKIHDMGISISIDDFGTGYSSLIRLKHLPLTTLKIEKYFIQDAVLNPNSAIIVSCLIALGKNLGLNVIAEGIETEQQLEFLLANKCPQGQGFILGKPLTADKTTALLNEKIKINKKLTV